MRAIRTEKDASRKRHKPLLSLLDGDTVDVTPVGRAALEAAFSSGATPSLTYPARQDRVTKR